jgi:hypothetical protein
VDYANHGNNLTAVAAVQELLGDGLIHIPASSVAVEKLHANNQVNSPVFKASRKPLTIHINSYVLSCQLEHSRLRQAIDGEIMVKCKHRASLLMKTRLVSKSTAATVSAKPIRKDGNCVKKRGLSLLGSLKSETLNVNRWPH